MFAVLPFALISAFGTLPTLMATLSMFAMGGKVDAPDPHSKAC
jgi:uncharacterized membrane protein YadS